MMTHTIHLSRAESERFFASRDAREATRDAVAMAAPASASTVLIRCPDGILLDDVDILSRRATISSA